MSHAQRLQQAPSLQQAINAPRRIYLARHGQSLWNAQQRVTGQADPPLSMAGICQAEALRGLLLKLPLDAVYCSDLQRSRETAAGIAEARHLPLCCAPELREQHMGLLQGTPRDYCTRNTAELRARLRQNRVEFRPPGRGESFLDLKQRVAGWLCDTLPTHLNQDILIVGHRDTNRALLSLLLGWADLKSLELPVSSDWVHALERRGSGRRLCSISLRERDLGTGYEGFQY